jgi:hypothetical protein
MANDDRYLYALVENTSTGDLVVLRRSIQGAWHVFYYETGPTKTAAHIAVSAALGYQALFLSYSTAGQPVIKAIRLSQYPNAVQDSAYRYDTSRACRIRMPRFGSSEAQIVLERLTVQTRNCAVGRTITPYYSVDDGPITQFGTAAITTSPAPPAIIPATSIFGNYFDFYFDFATNDATQSPALLGFSIKGLWGNQRRRSHTWEIDLTKWHSTRRGGMSSRDFQSLLADLDTLRSTRSHITITDEDNRSFQGLVGTIKVIRKMPTTTKGRETPETEGRLGIISVDEKPTT